jgi:hypothetical protein
MGLDINAVQFLIAARRRGIEFGEVLMLGRQDLNVFPAKLRELFERNHLPSELFKSGIPDTKFAEPVFKSLGAPMVHSLDFSAYEGASLVHDLNKPIGPELRERFDTVYDGGTLEHVFQFPTALKNAMEMVRVGGHLFIHTVTNNYCGHGFYQFSPELFFRALSEANGYEVGHMVLHAMGPYGRWYEVSNPEQIRDRVELITMVPVQLLIQAKRTRQTAIFEKPPQQGDFVARWDDSAAPKPSNVPVASAPAYGAPRPKLAKILPGLARLLNATKIGLGLLRNHSVRNRRNFRPVPKP